MSCENCHQFERLKKLAGVVVVQYENICLKYKDTEKQYNALLERLADRESQLKEMKKLIEPAISEYEKMKMKYEIEVGCRTQAERFASKINVQNKELKRQSQMLLDLRGSSPPDFSKFNLTLDAPTDSMEDYNEELQSKLQNMEDELAECKTKLLTIEEDLTITRERYADLHDKYDDKVKQLKQTENALIQYKDAMEDMSKVSEEALQEYEQLKEKYELEVEIRNGAEKFATEIRIQNEAIKKQSTILLSNAAANPQLMVALNDVENLTTQLEELKLSYQAQIKELEEKLEENSENAIQSLETENNKLTEEKENLETKLLEYEKQYKDLEKQYKEVEEKLEKALRPPPPPPPPPPPVSKSKGFLSKIKKDKKNKTQTAKHVPQGSENYSQALEEMMKRINSGQPLNKTLRPVRRPSEPSESPSAMGELNKILSRMKRTQSEGDISVPEEQKTELQKIFEKRANKHQNTDESGAVTLRSNQKAPSPEKGPKHLSSVDEESGSEVFDASS